jgi:hypothetical protein
MSGRGDNNKHGSSGRGASNQSGQGLAQGDRQKTNHGKQTGGQPSQPESPTEDQDSHRNKSTKKEKN